MAKVTLDFDIKVPREVIRKAVDQGVLASAIFVKKRADQLAPVGKWKRPIYKKGKYRGKTWTARRPGQLRRTGEFYKSKFRFGGAVVQYGTFNAFYGFMTHWGSKNWRSGRMVGGSEFLRKGALAAAKDIEREVGGRIKAELK